MIKSFLVCHYILVTRAQELQLSHHTHQDKKTTSTIHSFYYDCHTVWRKITCQLNGHIPCPFDLPKKTFYYVAQPWKKILAYNKHNILTTIWPKIAWMKIWKPVHATFFFYSHRLFKHSPAFSLYAMKNFVCRLELFLYFKCYFLAFQDLNIFKPSLSFSLFCLHCTSSFV